MYWIENFLISRVRAEKYAEIMEKIDSGKADFESFSKIENLILTLDKN
jgi:hypothetical protein